jgi:predicted metal-dependent hydrolase
LIRNHKSAEKLNELNRKIQHMIEEKNMLNQSHGLIVENLTNEIKSLTEKLNEYKKKDLTLNLNLHKEDQVKEENRIKVTNNKTEVVSVTPTASGTALFPDTAKGN